MTTGAVAEVAPGSAVTGQIPTGQHWVGAPAVKLGKAKRNRPEERPPRGAYWRAMYGMTGFALTALPLLAAGAALLVAHAFITPGAPLRGAALTLVPATLALGVFRTAPTGAHGRHRPRSSTRSEEPTVALSRWPGRDLPAATAHPSSLTEAGRHPFCV
ncbi:hypothetical protein [Streptomyces sp. HUAS ZL42]|uniref:hypothetical protein n=1 Tax=Streptomyces sp. HUAS ZL42 TaxID=3231715 RepID=UPI00345E66B5